MLKYAGLHLLFTWIKKKKTNPQTILKGDLKLFSKKLIAFKISSVVIFCVTQELYDLLCCVFFCFWKGKM